MSEHAPVKEAVIAALHSEHGPGAIHENAAPTVENEETDDLDELDAQEAEESQVEASQEEGAEETQEETPEPLSPPQHWSQDDQARFQALDRASQEFLIEREKSLEADYTGKMQTIAPVQQILDQNKTYFDSLGTSPDSVLNYFIGADRTLRTGMPEEKRQALLNVAQQYGIDLQAPAQTAPDSGQFYDGEGNPVDIAGLVQQAVGQAVQGAIQPYQQAMGNFLTSQQQTEYAKRDAQIEEFRNARDDSGNLKHPHFDRLKPQIEQLAAFQQANGQTPDLAKLYTGVCATDPIAIQEMQESVASLANATKQEKVAKKKAAAKAQVTGSRTSPSVEQKSFKTAEEAARHAVMSALEG